MLYEYSLLANANNWLHECLKQVILSIHDDLDNRLVPASWPDIIPAQYRVRLKPHKAGLNGRLLEYIKAASKLDAPERLEIATAFSEQNDIPGLLNGSHDCLRISQLPLGVRLSIKELFVFSFKLLTKLKLRDDQYKIIYKSARHKVCAFCGCEHFNSPKGPREALDHYLAESIYPLAAANLNNLAPIGTKCNSQYKIAQDIIKRTDGTRRRAFDPFNCTPVSISLDNSELSNTLDGTIFSDWKIDFDTQSEEVETWDEVFSIRTRYTEHYLLPLFNSWLQEFMDYCKALRDNEVINLNTPDIVLSLVTSYYQTLREFGLADVAFLKCAVFKLLLKLYSNGNNRIILLMNDLYKGRIDPLTLVASTSTIVI
jgi:hypothetical protein